MLLRFLLCIGCISLYLSGSLFAQTTRTDVDWSKIPTRELYVPSHALSVLLSSPNERVVMARSDYEELLAKAEISPSQISKAIEETQRENAIPVGYISTEAKHKVQLQSRRVSIESTYRIELLKRGWHAIPLELRSVQLLEATWDGKPALLGPMPEGTDVPGTILLCEGVGVHQLTLRCAAIANEESVQQSISMVLPDSIASEWSLKAEGDVEILHGAHVAARSVNPETKATTFDLVPLRTNEQARSNSLDLTMTLNHRTVNEASLFDVQMIQTVDLSPTSESSSTQFRVKVHHGSLSRLEMETPTGYEILKVQSPFLARWGLETPDTERPTGKWLVIEFREGIIDETNIIVVATNTDTEKRTLPYSWQSPKWNVPKADQQQSLMGVFLSEEIRWQDINVGSMIPVQVSASGKTIRQEPSDGKELRHATTLYDPDSSQTMTATISRVASAPTLHENWALMADATGLRLSGVISIANRLGVVETVEFGIPNQWRVERILSEDLKPLSWSKRTDSEGSVDIITTRIHPTIGRGQSRQLIIELASTPEGWLSLWDEKLVVTPQIQWRDLQPSKTVLSVEVKGDFQVEERQSIGLEPIFLSERPTLAVRAEPANSLAFVGVSDKWTLETMVTRKKPRITAEAYQFVNSTSSGHSIKHEIHVTPDQASIDEFAFSLPETTPSEISIRAIQGVSIRGYTSQIVDGRRVWDVKLLEKVSQPFRVIAEYQLPLTDGEFLVPIARIENVVFQSGLVALDRDESLDIAIRTALRRADVGELIDSETTLGPNFLGVFGYARFETEGPSLAITSIERELVAMPPTIAESLDVQTWLSGQKWGFHQADFQLKTAVNRLSFVLPQDAELWSVSLDGLPTLPQRHRDTIIVELPEQRVAPNSSQVHSPTIGLVTRHLKIAYAAPLPSLALQQDFSLDYPRVTQTSGDAIIGLPIADIKWTVHTSPGVRVTSSKAGVVAENGESNNEFPFCIWSDLRYWISGVMLSDAKIVGRQSIDRGQTDSEQVAIADQPFLDEKRAISPKSTEDGFGDTSLETKSVTPSPASPKGGTQIRNPFDATRSLDLQLSNDVQWTKSVWMGYGDQDPICLVVHSLSRWRWLALGIAMSVVALSLFYWNCGVVPFVRWGAFGMVMTIVASMIVPHAYGFVIVCESTFWAMLMVVCVRLLCGLVVNVLRFLSQSISVRRVPTTELTCVILLCFFPGSVIGQTVPAPIPFDGILERLRAELTTQHSSVPIPSNAIVVPYEVRNKSVASRGESRESETLLIPYLTYDYLQGLATSPQPAKTPPLRTISLATMNYRATLADQSSLELEGSVRISHHGDRTELVPFVLSTGVLTQAEVNGQQAKLHSAPQGFLVALDPSTEPYEFVFKVLIKSTSEAGWKRIVASIPNAPATQIQLHVPDARTELRMQSGETRSSWTTLMDDEVVFEGMSSHKIDLQWRPKVTQIEQDRSLNAVLTTQATVTETGLNLQTSLQFLFRQGQREDFLVEMPQGIRVERVTGSNVKSWDTIEGNSESKQRIRISLLKPALEKEEIQLMASVPQRLGIKPTETVKIPEYAIPEAVNTRGSISIFASAQLNVSISSSTGLVREDIQTAAQPSTYLLGLRAIAAFRHPRNNYALDLIVQPIPPEMESISTHVVTVTRSELQIESTIVARVRAGQIDGVDLLTPQGWDWEILTASIPTELELASSGGSGQRIRLQLSTPIQDELQVKLKAKQKRDTGLPLDGSSLAIPSFRVLGSSHDQGTVIWKMDRGIDALVRDTNHCVPFSLGSDATPGEGLIPKLGVRYQMRKSNDSDLYSGVIDLRALKPSIDSVAVSNVKITKHSVEQTVYIEWSIRNAGVSEISFVLPSIMRDAKLAAPLVRRVTKQPLNAQLDAPIRFRIELQDQVLGDYRVLLQHDRPWTPDAGDCPIASEITGNVRHRFVTLENAGFDELMINQSNGMSALMRGDTYWNEFESILGSPSAQAFRVNDAFDGSLLDVSNAGPRLAYQPKSRSALETVNARIGLATTELSVDEFGRYRGIIEIRMENFSEPFLEIELPSGSELWSAIVADQPAKPGTSPNKPTITNASRVRVPLIRTQKGDLDYPIRLGYAGRLSALSTVSRIELPFVKTINIQVERSQLKLRLPENHHWYGFEGTLGQVANESDLVASWLSFRNKQIRQLKDVVAAKSNDQFSQGRALENVKRLSADIQSEIRSKGANSLGNRKLQEELLWNESALRDLKKDEDEFNQQSLTTNIDNRDRLGQRFAFQCNERAIGNWIILEEALKSKNNTPASPSLGNVDPKPTTEQSKSGETFNNLIGSNNGPSQPPLPSVNSPSQQALQQQVDNASRKGDDVNQLAQRYRGRIQSQSAQTGNALPQLAGQSDKDQFYGSQAHEEKPRGGMSMGGGMGGGLGGMDAGEGGAAGMSGGGMRGYGNRVDISNEGYTLSVPPSGRRSLDMVMPMRGREYLFETPKGELQLVARGVDSQMTKRLILGLIAVTIASVVWISTRKRK